MMPFVAVVVIQENKEKLRIAAWPENDRVDGDAVMHTMLPGLVAAVAALDIDIGDHTEAAADAELVVDAFAD